MRLAPLGAEHIPHVQPLAGAAFDELSRRHGRPTSDEAPEIAAYYTEQQAHLMRTDGGLGAFDDGGALVGVALSYARGDLWVLALLAVHPDHQSSGIGSSLLRAALQNAPRRRLLHASRDARAMRAYVRTGFRLLPALEARGVPTPDPEAVPLVDAPLTGPFTVDLGHVRSTGGRVLSLPDGREGVVVLAGPSGGTRATVVSAQDERAAADLLRGALAVVEGEVVVGPFAPQEDWAVGVALDARLDLGTRGPIALAGFQNPLAGPLAPIAVYV